MAWSALVNLLAAAAASVGTSSTAPRRATPLDGVTVAVPRTAPVVVSTWPKAGSAAQPGVMVLKVTFDQSMDPDGWSYGKGAAGAYPNCLTRPRLLADRRTFVLLCTAGPKSHFAVTLNGPGTGGFVSVGHRLADPFELKFDTSDDEPIFSLPAAMTAAGLKDDEGPVQGSAVAPRDAPSVSRPPAEPRAPPDDDEPEDTK